MIKDPQKRLDGTISLVISALNDTPGQSSSDYLKKTNQKMNKSLFDENVIFYGVDTYRDIIDVAVDGVKYHYYVNEPAGPLYDNLKKLSTYKPYNALNKLKGLASKVLTENELNFRRVIFESLKEKVVKKKKNKLILEPNKRQIKIQENY